MAEATVKEISGMRFTLKKGEKLRHRSLIEGLFKNGSACYDFPLRMVWRRMSSDELASTFKNNPPDKIGKIQMMVTIPKKKRKRAVDRVLMRRRIREAYRLNRNPLRSFLEDDTDLGTLSVAFIYMHNENTDFAPIEKKMKHLLGRLKTKCQNSSSVS